MERNSLFSLGFESLLKINERYWKFSIEVSLLIFWVTKKKSNVKGLKTLESSPLLIPLKLSTFREISIWFILNQADFYYCTEKYTMIT